MLSFDVADALRDYLEDNHVPPAGRDLIRKTLTDAGTDYSFYEVAWAQRK